MSYKKLEIWQLARQVVIETHEMTLQLPAFEMYEEGRQIRKSSKSTKSNIVEEYGRRAYKADFLRFLVYAQASNDETLDHLENLQETGSLSSKDSFNSIFAKLNELGKKLNRFIQAVNKEHNLINEDSIDYGSASKQDNFSGIQNQGSRIKNPESRIKLNK